MNRGNARAGSTRARIDRGRPARGITTAALVVLAWLSAAHAGAAPPDIMGVDEIRPGMQGVGKTVFRGTQIEEFQVEIIGVLRGASPNGDIILARASGGPLAQTGIIQGMSGSPIYIDGRLIGALSMGWSFSKEPIAGITPIGEMLDVMGREDGPATAAAIGDLGSLSGGDAGATGAWSEEYESAGAAAGERAPEWPAAAASNASDARLTRILTPMSVSGFDPRVLAEMVPWLERYGFVASQGGSGGSGGEGERYDVTPGSSVGVQLVSGDASVTGIGTVTYRDGDRLIAFGHPLFQAGNVDLPMTRAYIHGVLPNAISSFKLGSPLDPIGTLTQDRRPAIAGNIGASPKTIPVSIGVVSSSDRHEYNFRIVRDKLLLPGLLRFTAVNSMLAREAVFEEATTSTRTVFHLSNGKTIQFENLFAGFSGLAGVVEEIAVPAELVMTNRFEAVSIESVDLEVSVAPGRRTGRLEGITVSKNPVRPGESITVRAMVKTYQGPTRSVPIELSIPAGTPEGELVLRVCDAGSLDAQELKRAPLRNDWRDAETFFRRMVERRRNDHLYAQIEEPSIGVSIAGRELPAIPRSMFSVIDSQRHAEDAGVVSSSVLTSARVGVDLVITGCTTLPITIDSKAR